MIAGAAQHPRGQQVITGAPWWRTAARIMVVSVGTTSLPASGHMVMLMVQAARAGRAIGDAHAATGHAHQATRLLEAAQQLSTQTSALTALAARTPSTGTEAGMTHPTTPEDEALAAIGAVSMAALQLATELAEHRAHRARQETVAAAERTRATAAAEKATAEATLAQVTDPRWLQQARPDELAQAYQAADAWHDTGSLAAIDAREALVGQMRDGYGVDPSQLGPMNAEQTAQLRQMLDQSRATSDAYSTLADHDTTQASHDQAHGAAVAAVVGTDTNNAHRETAVTTTAADTAASTASQVTDTDRLAGLPPDVAAVVGRIGTTTSGRRTPSPRTSQHRTHRSEPGSDHGSEHGL